MTKTEPPIDTPLAACPDCHGEVMEFIRDEEESIIECRGCKRVWTISELWNALIHPTPDPLPNCRTAFERWHFSRFQEEPIWLPERNLYQDFGHHQAWLGWQACAFGRRTPDTA